MMTLDVAPETWDSMIHTAQRELKSAYCRQPDPINVAAAIRAALLVLMIKINPKGE